VQASYNGRNVERVEVTTDIERTSNFLMTGCMVDCKNFNIVIEGSFDLSTLILEATTSGRV
jgi:hypothetical protein